MYINSSVRFARLSAGRTPNTLQDSPDTVEMDDVHVLSWSLQDGTLLLKRDVCVIIRGEVPHAMICMWLCTKSTACVEVRLFATESTTATKWT